MIKLEHLLGDRWVPLTIIEFPSKHAADAYMRQMDPHGEYLRLAGGENDSEIEIDLNRNVPRNSKITPTIYTLEE